MGEGFVCELCGRRNRIMSLVCDNCHRHVCQDCIVFRDGKQLCRNCAYEKEGVKINEPKLIPA